MMSISIDALELIGELSQCTTEAEANALTKEIVVNLGAQSFVYTTVLPPDYGGLTESARFFIGCSSALCHLYSRRKWIMNDPYLDYARTNCAPIVGSKVKLNTQGQVEMAGACAQHGFRSGLVVPTHTSMDANKRIGLLYIGTDLSPEIGEPLLLKKRVQFVALGSELLNWWNLRLRQQAMRKFSLEEDEVEFLQLSKNGKGANEIAAICGLKVPATYRRLKLLKEKFDVDRIDHAVIQAEAAGLLG